MHLDNARNAKAEIFRKVFHYVEEPSAMTVGALPVFVPRALAGEFEPEEDLLDPRAEVAVGIAPPVGRDGGDAEGSDYQIVLLSQDKKLQSSDLIEKAQKVSKGEARFIYTGPVTAQSHWAPARRRPIQPGLSVGHHAVTAGTLGGFIQRGDSVEILSNNHVLAHVNRGRPGDDIVQPGSHDGGARPGDVAGSLTDFEPIDFSTASINFMDAATASISDAVRPKIQFPAAAPAPIRGARTTEIDIDDEVFKVGRTTGLTEGRVFAVEVDQLLVRLGHSRARFDGQFQVYSEDGHFSRPGDSGSFVIDMSGDVAGLLFAGSDSGAPSGFGLTSVNPIDSILSRFGATIWVG